MKCSDCVERGNKAESCEQFHGPCWCDGDGTASGHWHGSVPHHIVLTKDEAWNLLLEEVKAIREIIGKTAARRSGRPIQ